MKRVKAIVIVILVIGFAFGVFSLYNMLMREDEQELPVGTTMMSGIHEIGEMNTAEYYYTHLNQVSEEAALKIFGISLDLPFINNNLIYSYDGIIKAGIDFEDISVDIDSENKLITIILPEAGIMSHEIDENSYKVYYQKNNAFVPIDPQKVNSANITMKDDEESKAVSNGLLDRAHENAVRMLESFTGSYAELEGYTISIE